MSDLNMLVATGGRERTAADWERLLDAARFDRLALIPVPGQPVAIVEAAPRR